MRRFIAAFLLLPLLLVPHPAPAEAQLSFLSVPDLIKPGQSFDITVDSPKAGTATLFLVSDALQVVHYVMACTLQAGQNTILWDGTLDTGEPIAVGEYTLYLQFEDGEQAQATVRMGVPYPTLTSISQSNETLIDEGTVIVTYDASEDGTLYMQLFRYDDDTVLGETVMEVRAGENRFGWNGMMNGARVEDGEYAIVLSLRGKNGTESMQHYVYVNVWPTSMELVDFDALTDALMESITPPDVPVQEIVFSPPYSESGGDTFWGMHPGELSDAEIWRVLMQPITVYDNGSIRSMGHVYMMENPDGTGGKVAQIHGLSQGLHVVGEVNEHGYVLVEAFSNYDPDFTPKTDAQKAYAFDLKRGYLKAEHLKTIDVEPDIGFVIDKLTQRMYVFVNGVRFTELTISTGKITDGKYYRETIAGEFVTIGKSNGYWSNDLYSAYAIRFNGGTMLHETPYTVDADGTKYYGVSESYLGTKRSAGCVRVPRKANEEGVNQKWVFDHLQNNGRYKVIVWDDRNRYDTPTTWR